MKKLIVVAIIIVALILIAFAFLSYNRPFRNNGDAMVPAYLDGDLLNVDQSVQEFSRGDVIVFNKPTSDNKDIVVKRIIALPNEHIIIKNGNVIVNDKQLDLSTLISGNNYNILGTVDIALNSDEYFVIGDNHMKSLDSRFDSFGPVKRDEIIGKVIGKLKK